MSSYWDESVGQYHCAGPPGVPPGIEPGEFRPNCFAGFMAVPSLNFARFAAVAVGVQNFAVEFWMIRTVFTTHGSGDHSGCGGIMSAMLYNEGGYCAFSADGDVNAHYDDNAGSTEWCADNVKDPGWLHYVVNYERAANMTVYRNGIVAGVPDAITAVNLGNLSFVPWSGISFDGNLVDWWDAHDTDPAAWAFPHIAGVIGPCAFHVNTLLTTAQMQDSMERRYVQDLAQTQVLYDWSTVDGHTGWEGDRSFILRGISDYPPMAIAAPTGADNTVIVRDVSGNGNDWTLTTRAVYSAAVNAVWTTPGIAPCAFGSSSFFQHGGFS